MAKVSLGFSNSDACKGCDVKFGDLIALHTLILESEPKKRELKKGHVFEEATKYCDNSGQYTFDTTHDLDEGKEYLNSWEINLLKIVLNFKNLSFDKNRYYSWTDEPSAFQIVFG